MKKIKYLKFLAPAIITMMTMVNPANAHKENFTKYIENYSNLLTQQKSINLETAPKIILDKTTYYSYSKGTFDINNEFSECQVELGAKPFIDPNSYKASEPFFKNIQDLALKNKSVELSLNTLFIVSHELAHCDFAVIGTSKSKNLRFNPASASLIENIGLNKGMFNPKSLTYQPDLLKMLNEIYADIYGTANLLNTFVYHPSAESNELAKNLNLDTTQILTYAHKFSNVRHKTDLESMNLDPFHTSYQGLSFLLQPKNLEKLKTLTKAEDIRNFSLELATQAFLSTLKEHPEIMTTATQKLKQTLANNFTQNLLLASYLILNEGQKNSNDRIFAIANDILSKENKKYSFDIKNSLIKESGFNETEEFVTEAINKFNDNPENMSILRDDVKQQFDLLNNITNRSGKYQFNIPDMEVNEIERIKLKNS